MRSLRFGVALVGLTALLPGRSAHAQVMPVDENTPEACSDGADNDGNGVADCRDPRCFNMPNCLPPGEKPMTLLRPRPKQEVVAGALLIASAIALGGVSAGIIYETAHARVLAQSPGYFFGASLAGSSVAMIVLGIYYLQSGVHREDTERKLGLELTKLRIQPNVTFGAHGGSATATMHF